MVVAGQKAVQGRRVGRPRRAEAKELDEQILMAARRLLIERGFIGTTMENVAHHAGTTRQSVMYRFPDRDALLTAVAEQKANAVSTSVFSQDLSHRAFPKLREVARNLLVGATEPEMVSLFRVELGETGRLPKLSECLTRYNVKVERDIEDIVVAVREEEGKFIQYAPSAVATLITGVMQSHPIKRAMIGDLQFQDQQYIDQYFDQMWGMIISMA